MPRLALAVLTLLVSNNDALSRAARARCEEPTNDSPRRLNCSAKSKASLEEWLRFQQTLRTEAAAYSNSDAVAHPSKQLPRLIMIGDSITESFRGTAVGRATERSVGLDRALVEGNLAPHAPLVLAISGDETQHLLWRLRAGGELSPALCADEDAVISLLIGTNNIGNAGHSPKATAAGVMAVVREILQRTRARVLVNALLPRGLNLKKMAAIKGEGFAYKTVSLMPQVREVNALLNQSIKTLRSDDASGSRLGPLLDCGSEFLSGASQEAVSSGRSNEVRLELMPDGLHPNLVGQTQWAQCVLHGMQQLFGPRRRLRSKVRSKVRATR